MLLKARADPRVLLLVLYILLLFFWGGGAGFERGFLFPGAFLELTL